MPVLSDSASGISHDPQLEQQLLLQGTLDSRSNNRRSLNRADRVYQEEVKNMLIMLEHYKLQLSLVLPKVCLLIRRAQQKGSTSKLEKTRLTI